MTDSGAPAGARALAVPLRYQCGKGSPAGHANCEEPKGHQGWHRCENFAWQRTPEDDRQDAAEESTDA